MTENEILSFWAQWLRPSAGLPTVQWSLLLAVAAMAGYLTQRHTGLPDERSWVIRLVGTAAGLAGSAARSGRCRALACSCWSWAWPIVLFECQRNAAGFLLRWFRHNPWCWCRAFAESVLDLLSRVLGAGVAAAAPGGWPLALVALAASPAVLTRVVADTRRAGDGARHRTHHTLHALRADFGQCQLQNSSTARASPCWKPSRPWWWCWACPFWSPPRCLWCCASRCAS